MEGQEACSQSPIVPAQWWERGYNMRSTSVPTVPECTASGWEGPAPRTLVTLGDDTGLISGLQLGSVQCISEEAGGSVWTCFCSAGGANAGRQLTSDRDHRPGGQSGRCRCRGTSEGGSTEGERVRLESPPGGGATPVRVPGQKLAVNHGPFAVLQGYFREKAMHFLFQDAHFVLPVDAMRWSEQGRR